jgi:hypothetical protein
MDMSAAQSLCGSPHGHNMPTVPAPVSELKDGMSVTIGDNPQASASIKE